MLQPTTGCALVVATGTNKMSLLDTAKKLRGKELDAWLESLSPEEVKELWVQGVAALLKLLDPLTEVFEPEEE